MKRTETFSLMRTHLCESIKKSNWSEQLDFFCYLKLNIPDIISQISEKIKSIAIAKPINIGFMMGIKSISSLVKITHKHSKYTIVDIAKT